MLELHNAFDVMFFMSWNFWRRTNKAKVT